MKKPNSNGWVAGHCIASMLLLSQIVRRMPAAERRAVVRGALAELDALANRRGADIEAARDILVGLLRRPPKS